MAPVEAPLHVPGKACFPFRFWAVSGPNGLPLGGRKGVYESRFLEFHIPEECASRRGSGRARGEWKNLPETTPGPTRLVFGAPNLPKANVQRPVRQTVSPDEGMAMTVFPENQISSAHMFCQEARNR